MKGDPVSGAANRDIRVGKSDSVRKMGEETEGRGEQKERSKQRRGDRGEETGGGDWGRR